VAAGDLIVKDYQFEIWRSDTDRLLLGRDQDYIVPTYSGFANPDYRALDIERASDHGGFGATKEYLDIRRIVLDVQVLATSLTNLHANLGTLAKVCRPADADIIFSFQFAGQSKRRLNVRPRRSAFGYNKQMAALYLNAAIELIALDPRIYSAAVKTSVISILAASSSQAGTLTNDGNFPTRPSLSIVGPATNPRIQNTQDANKSIKIDVVLGAPDTLLIDIDRKTVKLNGVDRYDLVRTDNQWWELQPGANTITYSRTGTTGQSDMTCTFRDAWIAS
jgi:hypothetical protein